MFVMLVLCVFVSILQQVDYLEGGALITSWKHLGPVLSSIKAHLSGREALSSPLLCFVVLFSAVQHLLHTLHLALMHTRTLTTDFTDNHISSCS